MSRSKRPKAEPTDDWQELLPLFTWPEQHVKVSGEQGCEGGARYLGFWATRVGSTATYRYTSEAAECWVAHHLI